MRGASAGSTPVAIAAACVAAVVATILLAAAPPQRPVPLLFGIARDTSVTETDRVLYLQKGDLSVGIDKNWGGAIREIWYKNQNLINNFDGGRLAGVSLYDGPACDPCAGAGDPNWGWNGTPSDKHNNPNPLLDYTLSGGVLQMRSRLIQWNPDNKGGGRGAPISTDLVVSTRIELFGVDPGVIHARYRVIHEGSDTHRLNSQEWPFAYVRTPFAQFVAYQGAAPWTGAAVSIAPPPPNRTDGSSPPAPATEHWAGFVNSNDEGFVLWAPQATPVFYRALHTLSGPTENSTNYLSPVLVMSIGPGFDREIEAYYFAGKWQAAREQIYAIQRSRTFADILPPFGHIDIPQNNATVSGNFDISGWALDLANVSTVEVSVDRRVIGRATYGLPRPDVAVDYPSVAGAGQSGYVFHWDTRSLSNGSHFIEVKATDTTGNMNSLIPGEVSVTVRN